MQPFARFLLIGVAGFALAAPAVSQRSDDQILPKSAELQRQAREAVAAGKLATCRFVFSSGRKAVSASANSVERRDRPTMKDVAALAGVSIKTGAGLAD